MHIKQGIIKDYSRKKMWRKRATKILGITGAFILLVAAVSYYGQNVGSFVIRMNNSGSRRGMSLSEHADLSEPTTRLTANPLSNATDADFSMIPSNIDEGDGVKNGVENRTGYDLYFAYTFYLFNNGTETINYAMDLKLDTATRNIDSIMRVYLITDGVGKVYAKAQEGENAGQPEEIFVTDELTNSCVSIGQTIPFQDDNVIVSTVTEDFRVNQVTRYTLVMWLDGWDKDQTQEMLGGALKLSLDFYLAE